MSPPTQEQLVAWGIVERVYEPGVEVGSPVLCLVDKARACVVVAGGNHQGRRGQRRLVFVEDNVYREEMWKHRLARWSDRYTTASIVNMHRML